MAEGQETPRVLSSRPALGPRIPQTALPITHVIRRKPLRAPCPTKKKGSRSRIGLFGTLEPAWSQTFANYSQTEPAYDGQASEQADQWQYASRLRQLCRGCSRYRYRQRCRLGDQNWRIRRRRRGRWRHGTRDPLFALHVNFGHFDNLCGRDLHPLFESPSISFLTVHVEL